MPYACLMKHSDSSTVELHIQYYIDGAIDVDMLRSFLIFVRERIPDECETLDLFINSAGGSVPIALAMAELLMALPCEVRTCNLSNVDSASIIVFAAGKERFAPPGTTFFFHPVGKEVSGIKSATELRQLADEIDHDTLRETEFLSLRTGTDAKKWRDMMDSGILVDDSTALKLGLATSSERLTICPSALVVNRMSQSDSVNL